LTLINVDNRHKGRDVAVDEGERNVDKEEESTMTNPMTTMPAPRPGLTGSASQPAPTPLGPAPARPAPALSRIVVPAGLKGVIVADTELGDVRGTEGFYHYRQYSAVELAERCSLEDVWFLMFEGRLPSPSELEGFVAATSGLRTIPAAARVVLPAIATSTDAPLDAFRTAMSFLAAHLGLRPLIDTEPEERHDDALRLCAVTPALLAALHRLHEGLEPIEPRADLRWAENYLWMLHGEEADARDVRAVERYLILTVDHGFNASTFTGRVIASTGADIGAALVGAIGAMSGPLHGGAPSRALELLDEIGPLAGTGPLTGAARDRVDEVILAKLASGAKIMGFGHAVYQGEDPRSTLLRDVARDLGGPLVDHAARVEQRVIELLDEFRPGRNLRTNVEYYAGVVMSLCGIPPEMFTPTFTSSRVIGWSANILEQADNGKILRPSARYVGPPPPAPIPAARRDEGPMTVRSVG
jgi:citrate synthase